ncbi:hypothetical protein [Corynebacterium uterequi]|uniref:Glucitol operon activator n=1 Tax=Corynebacterium uterequi TaxID=1072256 RepID=A0A0G3HKW9_9CORY|nr:hypothetical protein [Corynebacterium uterequi]AKK11747.1 glucitol operon activator [Corynebacterium uterequi]
MSEQEKTTDDQPDPASKKVSTVRVRAWHIVLLVVIVAVTLSLAWWQWTRFRSGSGTFQNLGYALQWPLFGAFFVYAYRMGVKYENDARRAQADADDPDYLYQADLREFEEQPTRIDDDFLPARPHLNVEEFNRLNPRRRGQTDYPKDIDD